jgi:hypothetical protein
MSVDVIVLRLVGIVSEDVDLDKTRVPVSRAFVPGESRGKLQVIDLELAVHSIRTRRALYLERNEVRFTSSCGTRL